MISITDLKDYTMASAVFGSTLLYPAINSVFGYAFDGIEDALTVSIQLVTLLYMTIKTANVVSGKKDETDE